MTLDDLLAEKRWVRALAARLAPDASAADDLEQETWLAAMRSPPPRAGSPRAWLGTVVRNLARTAHRRSERRGRHEAFAAPSGPAASAGDVVAEAELHARLIRAVLELDEPYRSVVLLRFFRGLGPAEIAAQQGAPVETVKTRVKRAIERLRERMGAELGDDRDAWALLVFGVRESVGKVPQTVPTLSSAAAVGGGLAMAAGTKIAVAAVVLVAGAAWWVVPRDGGTPERSENTVSKAAAPVAPPRAGVAVREPRVRTAPLAEDAKPATDVAAKPPPDGDVVHGRVIDDETEKPVAKVTVSLVWEMVPRTGKEPSSVTGDDGTFRVPGAKDGQFGDLLLQAGGYAETIVDAPWIGAGTTLAKFDAGDVRIYRGRRVSGRVLAADGRTPARIALSKIGGGSGTMWFSMAKEYGRAGDDGRFDLERVPPSPYTPYTLMAASPDGVGWARLPAIAGKADVKDVEVRPRPTGSVTVTVQDESGTPQANARVFASPRFEPLGPRSYGEPNGHSVWLPGESAFAAIFGATTDAAGVARLTKLPIGDDGAAYDFIVHGRGVAWQDHVVVAAGEEKAITIVVTAPKLRALVAGVRVVDGDGKPVEGATVTVVSGPRDAKATTDADGVAVVERTQGEPTAGVLGWFDVVKEGFAKQNVGVRRVADDGSPLPTVTLVRPAPIEGRVVDQDGKPVVGCSVSLMRDGVALGSPTTGADGKFAFPDAVAGEWTLRYLSPKPWDEWAYDERMSAVRGGDCDVVVVLRRLPAGKATLVATIVDADTGAPLTADDAMLAPAANAAEPCRIPDATMGLGEGTITFPRLRPGRYRLWLKVPGRVPAVADVEVRDGQTDVAARVAVGHGGTLRGSIDVGGTAAPMLPGIGLRLADDWTSPQWATYHTEKMWGAETVKPDGTFVFSGVTPARYRFESSYEGFIYESAAVDVPSGGEATVVVTVTQAGQVSFGLRAASPSDTIQYDVSQDGGAWQCVMRFGGEKGKTPTFAATLRPGRYRWRVMFPAQNYVGALMAAENAEGDVTVVAGETAVVEVPVVAKR
jgi:RNA polymerase sigma-70 factor (ECF subfamily)